MKALLDTHTLFWAGIEPERIGKNARAIILNAKNDLLVSAATAWEIATKVRLGRWPEAVVLEANFLETVSAAGYEVIPISGEDALRAGRMPGEHRDPFDRMIAAQALARDVPVLSQDAELDSFQVRRVW